MPWDLVWRKEVKKFRLSPLEALGPQSSSRKLFPSNDYSSMKEWALGEIVSSPALEANKSLCGILEFRACPCGLGCAQRG